MKLVAGIVREIVGLFVEDGALALAMVAVVASAALVMWAVPQVPTAAGCVLLVGCVAALLINVCLRAGRR